MYQKRNAEWLRHIDFEIFDLLILILSYAIVEAIRRGSLSVLLTADYTRIYFGYFLMEIVTIFFMHPYKDIMQRGHGRECSMIIRHFLTIDAFLIVFLYLLHVPTSLPRMTIVSHLLLSVGAALVFHIVYKHHLRLRLNRHPNYLVLLSDSEHIRQTYRDIIEKEYTPYQIRAILLLDQEANIGQENASAIDAALRAEFPELQNIPILHDNEEAMEYLRTNVVDEAFVDRYDNWDHWKEDIDELITMGVVVNIGLAGLDTDFPNRSMRHFGKRLVLTTTIKSAYRWQLAFKRLIDICGALVGLLLTGLIGIFVVPAIKIADPGPCIFSQTRIGKNGRPFKFYKFRSMYMDAEARKAELMAQNQMSGFMFKMENDPRIIGSEKGPGKGIGNFIRKTSIDELPQFWNVLIGDMSLVGTRPPTMDEYNQYELHHKIRLSMQPGITGMWQVSGRSDITDFEEVVRLDTKYIEEWNVWLDIKILFKTVMVVFKKEGSR